MNGYLRHLANFARVVNAGSITVAANRMNTSPSTMSESVRVVEAFVGAPLLERGRAGVSLMGDGERVYREAMVILDALERFVGESAEDAVRGQVRISLPIELASGWFDSRIAELQREVPEIELVFFGEDQVQDYARHSRDLYIRVGRVDGAPGLTELASGPTEAVLVGRAELLGNADPADPDVVAELTMICKPRTEKAYPLPEIDGARQTCTRLLQVSDVTTRVALMRAGLGITGCLRNTVAGELASGRLVQLLPGHFGGAAKVTIGAPDRRVPARVRRVAEGLARAL